jgi:regulator of protease activity HflC (stomatin/prohibitin superfamily)
MGWFILTIILWLAAVIAFVAIFVMKANGNTEDIPIAVSISLITVVLGFVLFTIAGLKSVPVKNIGVPVAFGAVGTTVYQPGIHETWTPWLHLTDINETVQTTTFEDSGNDSGSSCNGGLPVRIGGQQTACADVTIQWQILPSAAGSLFSDYANQGDFMTEVTNAVVLREFKTVVNTVVGDYNPITDVEAVTNTKTTTSQFTQFPSEILAQMRADIGNRINVIAVQMPIMHYNASIEAKLASIQQAYANYAIAQENVLVAQENAKAYTNLGTPSVNQLVAQCLDDVKDDGSNLPVGFQCFPGTSSGLALSK